MYEKVVHDSFEKSFLQILIIIIIYLIYIIYIINREKNFTLRTAGKHVPCIRSFLKFISHPLTNQIELLKVLKKHRKLILTTSPLH